MIAAMRPYSADERRQLDRDAALHEVLAFTAGSSGLSHRGEQDIRSAVMRLIEPILQLADHATSARLELEAIERRMDIHVRVDHPTCTCSRACWSWRVLQLRRDKLWLAWATAYRALVRGRR